MIHIKNWDTIEAREPGDFDRPKPGGYVVVIDAVTDVEKKSYLRIEWDFAEGPYKGFNRSTFHRAGFWPTALIRSYKKNAIGYFTSFKTCVEASNPGYVFSDYEPRGLEGKYMGVVLGEEEYRKNDGSIGKGLYVYQTRTVQAIRDRDFQVPAFKRLAANEPTTAAWTPPGFESTNEELPF